MRKVFFLWIVLVSLWGCSQYSYSPLSLAYHNTTAHYNAELQAEEKYQEAEKNLFRNRKENYAELLPVVMPIDSLGAMALKTELEAVVKKASLVAERHQNSKWLDDSYLLLGNARLLQADYKNAIETYKYINTNFEDGNVRAAALTNLMRAYIEQDQFEIALRVGELVRTLPLTKTETRDYYLTRAYLHQKRKEFPQVIALVEETLPTLKRGEVKARLHFVLGQLYEKTGKVASAQKNYAAVQKNRPNYDLAFYAGLNALLNDPSANPQERFAKMLSDRKNAELKDRIHFTMATFEERRGNVPAAIGHLKNAARAAAEKPENLPQIYLKLADLHYNPLQNYEASKAYYDSTVMLQPRNLAGLDAIIEKKKVLDEFVKHLAIVRTEDSLQRLAAMNPTALEKYLEKIISDREKQKEADLRRAEEIAAQAKNDQTLAAAGFQPNDTQGGSVWYFYNPSAVLRGKQDFSDRWGNRKLEDNWRRTSKEISLASSDAPINNLAPANTTTANNSTKNNSKKTAEIAQMKAGLPFGAAALAESRKKQEHAYFELGKIYQLGLNEPQKADETFTKLLREFPQTEHEAEALYLLFLIHEGSPKQAEYKRRLFEKFPQSYFVRLVNRNGLTPLDAGAEAEAGNLYASAYSLYQRGDYPEALVQTENGLNKFAGNVIEDKFALLRAMLLARVQDKPAYQQALNDFIRNYPKSGLTTLAQEMLKAAK